MFKRTYKRNIPLLAGLEFTSYFGITSFWILFFIQNGLSLLQIGLLESIFHGTSLLCEIPSGMLADRFSYKTNLYLARLSSIGSSILTFVNTVQYHTVDLVSVSSGWSPSQLVLNTSVKPFRSHVCCTVSNLNSHKNAVWRFYTLRKSNSNYVSFTLPYSSTACG